MSDSERDDKPAAAKASGPGEVYCKRLGKLRRADEHLDCPYCFGDKAAVEAAEHAKFCDHEPGVDPVCFGFPENTSRQRG